MKNLKKKRVLSGEINIEKSLNNILDGKLKNMYVSKENNMIISRNNILSNTLYELKEKINALEGNVVLLENLKQRNNTYKLKLADNNKQNEKLIEKCTFIEENIKAMKKENEGLKREIARAKIQKLKGKKEIYDRRNESENKEKENELNEMENTLTMLKKEEEKEYKKQNELNQQIIFYEKSLNELKNESGIIENKINQKKKDKNIQIDEINDQISQMDNILQEKIAAIEKLTSNLKQYNSNSIILDQKINEAKSKIDSVSYQPKEKEEQIHQLTFQYQNSIDNLHKTIQQKDKEIAELTTKYNKLNTKISKFNRDYKNAYKSLMQKNQELIVELNDKTKNYSDNTEKALKSSTQLSKNLVLAKSLLEKGIKRKKTLNDEQHLLIYENLIIEAKNNIMNSLIEANEKKIKMLKEKTKEICNLSSSLISKKVPLSATHQLNNKKTNEKIENGNDISKKQTPLALNKEYPNIGDNYLYCFKGNRLLSYHNTKIYEIALDIENLNLFTNTSNNNDITNIISLNTLKGLFFISGNNSDILFYYNGKINKILEYYILKQNHKSGAMIMDDLNNCIIILSGEKTNEVEQYSFNKKELTSLPPLSQFRAFGSYCFVDTKIFAFFGYDFEKQTHIENIEVINTKNPLKWDVIQLENKTNSPLKFTKHLSVQYSYHQVLILGGIRNTDLNYELYNVDCKKMEITMTQKSMKHSEKDEFVFQRSNNYNILLSEKDDNNEGGTPLIISVDDNCNIHFLNSKMEYENVIFEKIL